MDHVSNGWWPGVIGAVVGWVAGGRPRAALGRAIVDLAAEPITDRLTALEYQMAAVREDIAAVKAAVDVLTRR